jgi:hypothetical protein
VSILVLLVLIFSLILKNKSSSKQQPDAKTVFNGEVQTPKSKKSILKYAFSNRKKKNFLKRVENNNNNSNNNSSDNSIKSLNDSVFIGDSVTLKLRNYTMNKKKTDPNFLENVKFLSSGSLGCIKALQNVSNESLHPSYNGEKLPIEISVKKINPKKVFIMLGLNDVSSGRDVAIKAYKELVEKILKKCPDTKVYLQTVTPILKGKEKTNLTNKSIEEYNLDIKNLCKEMNLTYVDVASIMKTSDGYLKSEYCSDPESMGIHFTDTACVAWLEYLIKSC